MENIIHRILEIDQNARERITKAGQQKERIILNAKEDEEYVRCQVLKKADEKIAAAENKEKAEAEEKISAIEKDTAEKTKALRSIFEQNHEAWEQEIFQRIAGE